MTGGPVTGDEAALRALHLAPYAPRSTRGVGSVMLSYSSWQGAEMHVNKAMVTDVLKGELGFGGFVGTDYNGCSQIGVNPGRLAACLNAGVDMFMIFGAAAVRRSRSVRARRSRPRSPRSSRATRCRRRASTTPSGASWP